MKTKTLFRGLACAASAAFFAAACTENGVGPEAENLAPELSMAADGSQQHVFVTEGDESLPSDFAADVTAAGGTVVRTLDEIGVAITQGLSDTQAQDIAGVGAAVERDISVQWIPRPEEFRHSTTKIEDAQAQSHDPRDAFFYQLGFQWNMEIIDADDAWDQFSGDPSVTVAILDTGLDPDHQDQAGLIDAQNSIAFIPSISPKPGPPWRDDNFHGTHVGSIVVANGIGVSGVAPHVTLMAVKVLGATGSGSFGAVISGIVHAVTHGADVINMSLGAAFPKNAIGGGPLVAALNKAVNFAKSRGVLVASAAGNDDQDLQHNGNVVSVPCQSGSGMCISATDQHDEKASYSNFGTNAINVAAPGGDFDDPVPPGQQSVIGACSTFSVVIPVCRTGQFYLFVAGTSQATPHVSGAAAMLASNGVRAAAEQREIIQETAEDLGASGADPVYGKGRLNVCQALDGACQ